MLSVKTISFAYGKQPVLSGISIECAAGETVGIVGRSGSGKTTLLNVIAGYIACERGVITVDGMPPGAAARKQRIGYIFQTPTLMPWLTVRQNVELPLRVHRTRLQSTSARTRADGQVDDAL